MAVLTQLFEWLNRNFSGTLALSGYAPIVHEDCPHCGARTLCEVNVLHRYARCLECGRSVYQPDERDPSVRQEKDRSPLAAQ